MNRLQVILSFFADSNLDRHRLLQGQWSISTKHYRDGDLSSNAPLHHLTSILQDELGASVGEADDKPASSALLSLCHATLNSCNPDIFDKPKDPIWFGIEYVAQKCSEELQFEHAEVNTETLRDLINQP